MEENHDGKNTLFYLDPPYMDVEYYYNTNGVCFKPEDHKRLASILKKIKGKFVLSYYEHEVVRSYYNRFNIITKEVPKHSAGVTVNNPIKVKPKGLELLIKNY